MGCKKSSQTGKRRNKEKARGQNRRQEPTHSPDPGGAAGTASGTAAGGENNMNTAGKNKIKVYESPLNTKFLNLSLLSASLAW